MNCTGPGFDEYPTIASVIRQLFDAMTTVPLGETSLASLYAMLGNAADW